jgi:hypothetical protein
MGCGGSQPAHHNSAAHRLSETNSTFTLAEREAFETRQREAEERAENAGSSRLDAGWNRGHHKNIELTLTRQQEIDRAGAAYQSSLAEQQIPQDIVSSDDHALALRLAAAGPGPLVAGGTNSFGRTDSSIARSLNEEEFAKHKQLEEDLELARSLSEDGGAA